MFFHPDDLIYLHVLPGLPPYCFHGKVYTDPLSTSEHNTLIPKPRTCCTTEVLAYEESKKKKKLEFVFQWGYERKPAVLNHQRSKPKIILVLEP